MPPLPHLPSSSRRQHCFLRRQPPWRKKTTAAIKLPQPLMPKTHRAIWKLMRRTGPSEMVPQARVPPEGQTPPTALNHLRRVQIQTHARLPPQKTAKASKATGRRTRGIPSTCLPIPATRRPAQAAMPRQTSIRPLGKMAVPRPRSPTHPLLRETMTLAARASTAPSLPTLTAPAIPQPAMAQPEHRRRPLLPRAHRPQARMQRRTARQTSFLARMPWRWSPSSSPPP